MEIEFFNSDNHPELKSVALKGKYLQEFLAALADAVAVSKATVDHRSSYPDALMQRQAIDIQERLIAEITKGLHGKGAAAYGIDAEDLERLIKKASGVNIDDIDTRAAVMSLVQSGHDAAVASAQGKDPKAATNDESLREAATAMAMQAAINVFVECVTLQENKESDYLRLGVSKLPLMVQNVYRQKELLEGDDAKGSFCFGTAMQQLVLLSIYDRLKQRSSLLLNLYTPMWFGDKAQKQEGLVDTLRECMAIGLDLDMEKAADRDKLQRIERTALQKASESMGLPVPKSLRI